MNQHMSNERNQKTFRAPGRVNLIGEHTDYTGGYVMPMGIPFATLATIGPASDTACHFSTELFPGQDLVVTNREVSSRTKTWSDYALGVLLELELVGIHPPPFTLQLKSDVPLGAGLSSSASLEIATAVALLSHAAARLPLRDIALLCQRAENKFVGSPCGIMDQFASAAAVKGHALLLDTRTLRVEVLPMNTGGLGKCRIVIVNSGVKHSITQGGLYENRRRVAEEGQEVVRTLLRVRDLGGISLEQLHRCESAMSAEAYRRCLHIVSENDRVLHAAEAMRSGDPVEMGKAMLGSHQSQRDNFECSVPEIDFLVDVAMSSSGCYGSRLTGGGFGGCTVSLVKAGYVDGFVLGIRDAYQAQYGRKADTFVCEASDGAIALHPEVSA